MKECPNPNCRTQNRDDAAYCINCGRELGDVVPVTTTGGRTGGARSLSVGSRLQGGRYIVKKVLGEGGMGAALLATDNRLDNKLVVIKELISDNTDPSKLQDDVRNFKQEVATLAHIDHPLVPNVTDHFQEGSRYFMVQEYAEGETLEERMDKTNQPMKEREVLGYASEVLDVLDYLEQQTPPIVHRDIKPANIIIGAKDKRAHLVDFGIARADVARNAKRKQTSALGTPGYAPPEQYQGNADPRSDLYALAATMHHLLTNRDPRNHPPFVYPPVRALNPQLSPEIERVLSRSLTNDINHRYQSAAQMKQDVDEILLKRFGASGNMSSYVLGTSGPIKAANVPLASTAGASTIAGQPTIANQPTLIQQQAPPPLQRTANPPTPPPPVGWQGTPYQPIGSYTGRPPVSQPPRQSNVGRNFLLFILVILLIAGAAYAGLTYIRSRGGSGSTGTTPTVSPTGIGAIKEANGEYIGISDGTVAFDLNRADGNLKRQAADSLKNGDMASAQSLWDQAKQLDTNDAEALIYLEDQRVLASGRPYITIVIGTMLTGTDFSVGRSDLQGAYVAQKEFNDGFKLPNGVQVRLLVANSGSNKAYATTVAQQIVQLAKNDTTFVGVMGWPFSSRALNAVNVLAKAHIPMVSQTASSDFLSGHSPYFFRVSPSNKTEAVDGAKYAEQTLHAKNAALFLDPADPYSENLASDFKQQFEADGNKVVVTERYTIGKPEQLPGLLNDALTRNPDLIYFSGYPAELTAMIAQLPPCNASGCVKVLGGDALYQLKSYPSAGYPSASYNRLYFTAFAYPDMWNDPKLAPQRPANFFNDYAQDFDPNGKFPPHSKYGYNRADGDTMLSYDAMLAILKGYSIASDNGKKQTITPNDLQQALTKITGSQDIQGVSGRVEFDTHGDAVDKVVVVLRVDSGGFTQIDQLLGSMLK